MENTEPMPHVARLKPYYHELEAGRVYLWCACGQSANQPFCDGSHRGTSFRPVRYVAASAGEEVLFCGCKATCSAPFCDGHHNNLPGAYHEDDPASADNRRVSWVEPDAQGLARLDGRCYVLSLARVPKAALGSTRTCVPISTTLGAEHQSQVYYEVGVEPTPVLAFGESHVILFVAAGRGTVNIGGRSFDVDEKSGVYVRPGEAFQIRARGEAAPVRVYVSAGPAMSTPTVHQAMPDVFDASCPARVVSLDPAQRHRMAVRYFQMLVDKSVGSTLITQFIGSIPESKAEPHRHLYEEALIILSGRGVMWTETRKAEVEPGDVIFFPRKQLHSLQCTVPEGMEVVGVIYPGDNPSVNY
ncbi:MAG: cupin domain-containing protein [Vicinamibacterales bacterium]